MTGPMDTAGHPHTVLTKGPSPAWVTSAQQIHKTSQVAIFFFSLFCERSNNLFKCAITCYLLRLHVKHC